MKRLFLLLLACLFFANVATAQSTADEDKEFDAKITKAFKLVDEEKYDEAEKVLKEAIILRPDDGRPYAVSGLAHYQQWKLEEASGLFALAIKVNPNNPVLYYYRSLAEAFGKTPKDGLPLIQKAIELRPDYADAYVLLAYQLDDEAKRKEALEKAASLDRIALLRFQGLANIAAWKHKDAKAAEGIYRMLIEAQPDDDRVRGQLGRLLVNQDRLDEARSLWDEHPIKDEQTFPNFIVVLERAERLRDARKAYEANPDDPEILLQLGIATMDGDHWVVDGRQEKAIVYFQKALAIKPDFAKAQYQICRAYVQRADTFKKYNEDVDRELLKLRKMDKKLADDIVTYRNTYKGGLIAAPAAPKS